MVELVSVLSQREHEVCTRTREKGFIKRHWCVSKQEKCVKNIEKCLRRRERCQKKE